MLEVKQLKKTFGAIEAVRDVSFTVDKGEILGFLGPNGAGKTTTMRMITGFLPPTEGTATICGHDIIDSPVQAKKCIGYLPENAPVYSDMTVTNFLLFIAGIRGFRGKQRAEKVEDVIQSCYLERVRHQPVETLSKGFKQRVCFAQAVIHDPQVLVMDEPTDGLDPNQKFTVRSMIKDMSQEKAIIISTHILEEVEAVCSRAIIISDGLLVANGTPAELKSKTPSGRLDDVFRELTLGTEK
jgi:ABC-2 type transport system ATP-binding protein